MFGISFTDEALEDLRRYRRQQQTAVLDALEVQLRHEPTVETRNRKRLRPNQVAEWELRIGEMRVFYDVNTAEQAVEIKAVGHKVRSRLYLHGEAFDL